MPLFPYSKHVPIFPEASKCIPALRVCCFVLHELPDAVLRKASSTTIHHHLCSYSYSMVTAPASKIIGVLVPWHSKLMAFQIKGTCLSCSRLLLVAPASWAIGADSMAFYLHSYSMCLTYIVGHWRGVETDERSLQVCGHLAASNLVHLYPFTSLP
eukprot:1155681-Pelagomonas_calceolata.AAC.7